MRKCFCNMCGKQFDLWDEQEKFGFHYHVGYGSKHDGETIDVDLCCDCFDQVYDQIAAKCVYKPTSEE